MGRSKEAPSLSGFLSPGRSEGSYKPLPTCEAGLAPAGQPPTVTGVGTSLFAESAFLDAAIGEAGEDWEKKSVANRREPQDRRTALLESWPAQSCTIVLILTNAVVIGFETDEPHLCNWSLIENVFLVLFLVELVLRLYVHGWGFFRYKNNSDFLWNMFDLFIVTTGVINVLATLVAGEGAEHAVGKDATAFRMVRLLRILRVLRIIRIVRFLKQLYLLAYGFIEGTLAVFWVTLLASFMLYICSIILVRTYGRADESVGMDQDEVAFFQDKFGSIPRTMFSLFELISAPDLNPYRLIMFRNPALVVFLITFIVLGSFGINGLLVALINESILEKNQARLESDRMDREAKRKQMQKACGEIFDSLDVNRNRVVPRDMLLQSMGELVQVFEALGVNFQRDDLNQMFYIMDHNDTGIIERAEFVQGVLDLCDQIRPMSIMELHYQVSKCVAKVEQADIKVETMVKAAEQHELRLDKLQRAMDRDRKPAQETARTRFELPYPEAHSGPSGPWTGERHPEVHGPEPSRALEDRGTSSSENLASPSTSPVAPTGMRRLLYKHGQLLRDAYTRVDGLLGDTQQMTELENSFGVLYGLSESLLDLQKSNLEVLGALLGHNMPVAEVEAPAPSARALMPEPAATSARSEVGDTCSASSCEAAPRRSGQTDVSPIAAQANSSSSSSADRARPTFAWPENWGE